MKRGASIRTLFWVGFSVFTLSCFGQERPKIHAVVNSADYSPGLVEMSLVTIFGESLSAETASSQWAVLPTTLANTTVMVCGSKPPRDPTAGVSVTGCNPSLLSFVSPAQINFVAPPIPGAATPGATGPVWVVVLSSLGGIDEDAARGNPYQTFASISNPAVFQTGFDCYFGATDPPLASVPCGLTAEQTSMFQTLRGVVTDPSGNIVMSLSPLRMGTNYTIWLTGLNARGTPPAQADVLLEWAGQFFPASSMQGVSLNSSMGVQQVVFEVPALFDSTLPCMDRKADVAIQLSQTVSGVQYVSKPVHAPLLVKAGDIPCRSSP